MEAAIVAVEEALAFLRRQFAEFILLSNLQQFIKIDFELLAYYVGTCGQYPAAIQIECYTVSLFVIPQIIKDFLAGLQIPNFDSRIRASRD